MNNLMQHVKTTVLGLLIVALIGTAVACAPKSPAPAPTVPATTVKPWTKEELADYAKSLVPDALRDPAERRRALDKTKAFLIQQGDHVVAFLQQKGLSKERFNDVLVAYTDLAQTYFRRVRDAYNDFWEDRPEVKKTLDDIVDRADRAIDGLREDILEAKERHEPELNNMLNELNKTLLGFVREVEDFLEKNID
jgi:hypothetical protein